MIYYVRLYACFSNQHSKLLKKSDEGCDRCFSLFYDRVHATIGKLATFEWMNFVI